MSFDVILIVSLYITCELIANTTAGKPVALPGGITVPAAVYIYALTFTLIDLVNDRLGKQGARYVVYAAFLANLLLPKTLVRRYASPFPLRNQRWIYRLDTSGTYRERGNYLTRYAEHIFNIGQATPGVTAVFFSSYAFLEMVRAGLLKAEQALIVTEPRADAQADDAPANLGTYEARLRQLVANHGQAYLFAVYQGKLAQGANFTGNLVKTIICASIPMEYPALFHQRLETLYAESFAEIAEALGDDSQAKAREYARDRFFLSLVLQTCGRGIRSETDCCAFVLLDRRYHDHGWRRFLEPRPYSVRRPENNVGGFHQKCPSASGPVWDPALMGSDRKGGRE